MIFSLLVECLPTELPLRDLFHFDKDPLGASLYLGLCGRARRFPKRSKSGDLLVGEIDRVLRDVASSAAGHATSNASRALGCPRTNPRRCLSLAPQQGTSASALGLLDAVLIQRWLLSASFDQRGATGQSSHLIVRVMPCGLLFLNSCGGNCMKVAIAVAGALLLATPASIAQQAKGKAKCVRCVDLAKKCGDRVQRTCFEQGRSDLWVEASSRCGSWYRGCRE